MEELKVEVGGKESFRNKLVRSRFKTGPSCGKNGR